MNANPNQPIRQWQRLFLGVVVTMVCGLGAYWLMLDAETPADPEAPRAGWVGSPMVAQPAGTMSQGPGPRQSPKPEPVRRIFPALATLRSDGVNVGDDERVAKWVAQLRPDDLAQLLAYLLRSGGATDERQSGLGLLRHWAGIDPQAAATWLGSQPDLADRKTAVEQVATAWAENELEVALAWARQLSAGPEREAALLAVLYEGSQVEPQPAISFAMRELPAGAERDGLLKYAVAQWAAAEPVAAWSWAQKLDVGDLRDRIVGIVATEWSESDPVAGATLAVKELPVGRLQDDAIVSIVERWVQMDPQSVVKWVTTGLPAGPLQQTAATEMVKVWAQQAPEEVAEWLADLPAGMIRDAALTAGVAEAPPEEFVRAAE